MVCEDASVSTTKNTHHFVRQLGDALNEEPHLFLKGPWVNGTLRPTTSGATGGLPRIYFNSLTPIRVPAGTKNSRLVGFLQ